jgi:hypothetical protein
MASMASGSPFTNRMTDDGLTPARRAISAIDRPAVSKTTMRRLP